MVEAVHEKLQNQSSRTTLQKLESDMVTSIDGRFENTKLNLEDIAQTAMAGLNQLISMT